MAHRTPDVLTALLAATVDHRRVPLADLPVPRLEVGSIRT
jgi:hypothetical protein